jgi:hypothetical protein
MKRGAGLTTVHASHRILPILTDMGTHMKTTLDISDALFHSAKALAQQNQTTLRALVEEGLRLVLRQRQAMQNTFQLRDASVGGGQCLVQDASRWRDMANESEWPRSGVVTDDRG